MIWYSTPIDSFNSDSDLTCVWNQLFGIKCVKHKLNKWVCFIYYESYSIVNSWNHESWFLGWVKFCHARQQWVSFYLSIWSEDMKKGFSGSMTGSTLPVLFITPDSDLGQLSLKMRLQLIYQNWTLAFYWSWYLYEILGWK